MMTVDGIWCLLGSANWDMRSFRLNFELDVEVYHTDIIQQIESLMTARRGTLVTTAELEGLPLSVKLLDSGARLMLPYL
jgi:cardiolipin synthase A/B